MDPEFQKVLLRVLLVGGAIGIVSVAALLIAFRSFGQKEEKGDLRPFMMTIGAIALILVGCIVLLLFSFVR